LANAVISIRQRHRKNSNFTASGSNINNMQAMVMKKLKKKSNNQTAVPNLSAAIDLSLFPEAKSN
jgi:hypothetical protein